MLYQDINIYLSQKVNSLIFGGNTGDLMASCASDGSMRLWNTDSYEQTLQFLVLNQVSVANPLKYVHNYIHKHPLQITLML